MYRRSTIIVFTILCGLLMHGGLHAQPTPFSGPTYQAESAQTKMVSSLIPVLTQNNATGPWYSLREIELFLESMNLTFDTLADDMPYQFFGLERRPKLIHSVGVVARATWTPTTNLYTGVFSSGCKYLFVRLSLARQPGSGTPYTPGISVKCLRDGVHSANLVAMYSLLGQDSWNFFKHDFTNHVGDLSDDVAGPVLSWLRNKFTESSAYPVMVGLSDLATWQDDGTEIQNPVFPFRLVFHPTSLWHNFYPDAQPTIPFQQQLATTLRPSPIYEVYAQASPDDSVTHLTKIGEITITSPAVTSLFGDSLMFFQHARFEDDISFNPDWAAKAAAIMAAQRSVDNYVYPDLPWN